MSLLTIDQEKCKKNGLCAMECPFNIIRFYGDNTYPELIEGGEQMCVRCGHCVAVCPHDALKHSDSPISQSPFIDKALVASPEQVTQLLRSRRTIRHYKDRPVDKDLIQKVIELARYAPSGGNRQPVEWFVITKKETLTAISENTIVWMREACKDEKVVKAAPYFPTIVKGWDAGIDTILHGAPSLVVAAAPPTASSGAVDVPIALTHLDLAAHSMGLGTCWLGLVSMAVAQSSEVKQMIGIPDAYPHFYAMAMGHPQVRFYRMPERKKTKINWG